MTPSDTFNKLISDFVYGSLALSPVNATQNGYHMHQGASLDEALDDMSASAMAQQRQFLVGIQSRMAALDAKTLDREQAADLEIVKNNIGLSLLEIDSIQSYKHNPTVYVELAGNALFGPYVLNYAPLDKRFDHIIQRLEKMPALFEQAKANLLDSPEVWNRVAQEENQGNIDLIDKTLRGGPGGAEGRLRQGRGSGHRRTARVQRVPQGHAREKNQRLAPGQGKIRAQIRVRPDHRQDTRATAVRSGGRASRRPAPRWPSWRLPRP